MDIVLKMLIERPDSGDVRGLIRALDTELEERYPGEKVFGLHPEDVIDPGLLFVVARLGSMPVGCGALKRLDTGVGEIKRFYVSPLYRKRGYSHTLLGFLESEAVKTGYSILRLETGLRQPEALGLYRSHGYHEIPCYGEYAGNPSSVCFEKRIQGS